MAFEDNQPGEYKVSKVEVIKQESHHLRGNIEEELAAGTTRFTEDSVQILKFHGMYQQDDRDLRKQLKKEGKARHYMMMVRARIPGGILSPAQYLQFDKLADQYGNGTIRITTRQTFQLHGILKKDVKESLRSINEVLITTLGGCGDQVRNTIGCAAPHEGPFYEAVREDLLHLADRTSARTHAYHEIWLDGEKVNFQEEEEPLYGETYLPRKFKMAFAYEEDNCVDVYANDLGIVAHRDGDVVAGYTLLVGGGMGRTLNNEETYPRLATPFAFVKREALVDACLAVIEVQRDYGNRENRKRARMKYLIDEKGLDWFKSEVEKRFGAPLAPPRELDWRSSADHLGWHEQGRGKGYLGLYIPNGRLGDMDNMRLKSVLKEIVTAYKPAIHLTTQQNLLLAGLTVQARDDIVGKLKAAGVPLPDELSATKLSAMACPALPTCGLATAEAERVFPDVLPKIESLLEELGLAQEGMTVRMTGCPNGCARPYIGEIGFVGRAPGKYDVFLGGNPLGTRLNKLYKSLVPIEKACEILRPVLTAYAKEREEGEKFGDYCERVGLEHLHEQEEKVQLQSSGS